MTSIGSVGLTREDVLRIFGTFPSGVPDHHTQFIVSRNGDKAENPLEAAALYASLPKSPTNLVVTPAMGGETFTMRV